MNREIKFRAWTGTTMGDVTMMCLRRNGKYIPAVWFGYAGHLIGEGMAMESVTLMQFTGLKDKNGKEIFEGDILETGSGNMPVEWNATHGCWSLYGLGEMVTKLPDGASLPIYKYVEIIGNIYENPDLLSK